METGEIRVAGPLDRETRASYDLQLVASDSSPFSPLSSTVSVVVSVRDVNDNSPVFFNGEEDDGDFDDEDRRDFFVSPDTKEGDFILGTKF